jgi:hypothetical protein
MLLCLPQFCCHFESFGCYEAKGSNRLMVELYKCCAGYKAPEEEPVASLAKKDSAKDLANSWLEILSLPPCPELKQQAVVSEPGLDIHPVTRATDAAPFQELYQAAVPVATLKELSYDNASASISSLETAPLAVPPSDQTSSDVASASASSLETAPLAHVKVAAQKPSPAHAPVDLKIAPRTPSMKGSSLVSSQMFSDVASASTSSATLGQSPHYAGKPRSL